MSTKWRGNWMSNWLIWTCNCWTKSRYHHLWEKSGKDIQQRSITTGPYIIMTKVTFYFKNIFNPIDFVDKFL